MEKNINFKINKEAFILSDVGWGGLTTKIDDKAVDKTPLKGLDKMTYYREEANHLFKSFALDKTFNKSKFMTLTIRNTIDNNPTNMNVFCERIAKEIFVNPVSLDAEIGEIIREKYGKILVDNSKIMSISVIGKIPQDKRMVGVNPIYSLIINKGQFDFTEYNSNNLVKFCEMVETIDKKNTIINIQSNKEFVTVTGVSNLAANKANKLAYISNISDNGSITVDVGYTTPDGNISFIKVFTITVPNADDWISLNLIVNNRATSNSLKITTYAKNGIFEYTIPTANLTQESAELYKYVSAPLGSNEHAYSELEGKNIMAVQIRIKIDMYDMLSSIGGASATDISNFKEYILQYDFIDFVSFFLGDWSKKFSTHTRKLLDSAKNSLENLRTMSPECANFYNLWIGLGFDNTRFKDYWNYDTELNRLKKSKTSNFLINIKKLLSYLHSIAYKLNKIYLTGPDSKSIDVINNNIKRFDKLRKKMGVVPTLAQSIITKASNVFLNKFSQNNYDFNFSNIQNIRFDKPYWGTLESILYELSSICEDFVFVSYDTKNVSDELVNQQERIKLSVERKEKLLLNQTETTKLMRELENTYITPLFHLTVRDITQDNLFNFLSNIDIVVDVQTVTKILSKVGEATFGNQWEKVKFRTTFNPQLVNDSKETVKALLIEVANKPNQTFDQKANEYLAVLDIIIKYMKEALEELVKTCGKLGATSNLDSAGITYIMNKAKGNALEQIKEYYEAFTKLKNVIVPNIIYRMSIENLTRDVLKKGIEEKIRTNLDNTIIFAQGGQPNLSFAEQPPQQRGGGNLGGNLGNPGEIGNLVNMMG